jgi:hypothetical protein
MDRRTEVNFLVSDWGIKSTMAYRVVEPAHQATSAGGPVQQPYAIVDYIPKSGTKNLASKYNDYYFNERVVIKIG